MAAVESELPIVILGAGISGNVSFAKGDGGGGGFRLRAKCSLF